MDELGRRASRGQARGNFARYVARFSHSGYHDTPLSCSEYLHRFVKARIQPFGKLHNRLGFVMQHAPGNADMARCRRFALSGFRASGLRGSRFGVTRFRR
jgi:hypothetical protein